MVTVYLALVHEVRSLVLVRMLVPSASSNKPFGAPVTGSWSKRGVFGGTTSMRPQELTNVAMEAMVNEGTGNVTDAGVMNRILLEIEVVNPIWVIGGTAMCDGLRNV